MPWVVDPLGGSYYVETLTNQVEQAVFGILAQVDAMGGTINAIEAGWFQREIAESAYAVARAKGAGEHVVIGVNKHQEPPAPATFDIHRVDPEVEARQVARLRAVRARRDGARVAALLDQLAAQARNPAISLIPLTIELVRARATLGEIVARLRNIWGAYVERPVF